MDFNGDSLSIGVVGSSFKTEITNTEMAFTENGEKVAEALGYRPKADIMKALGL